MNAADKAKVLLAEGRLWVRQVQGDLVVAQCRGYSGDWLVGFLPEMGRWHCTCPANARYGRECSHIRAACLVCVRQPVRELVPG